MLPIYYSKILFRNSSYSYNTLLQFLLYKLWFVVNTLLRFLLHKLWFVVIMHIKIYGHLIGEKLTWWREVCRKYSWFPQGGHFAWQWFGCSCTTYNINALQFTVFIRKRGVAFQITDLEKGGLTVPCKLQLKDNEKLRDQQWKMLFIVPVPADSIPMMKALMGYSDV